MKDKCKHDWRTRYSKFGACEGVEWYCVNRCNTPLPWPEVIKRVNEYDKLTETIVLLMPTLLANIKDTLRELLEIPSTKHGLK